MKLGGLKGSCPGLPLGEAYGILLSCCCHASVIVAHPLLWTAWQDHASVIAPLGVCYCRTKCSKSGPILGKCGPILGMYRYVGFPINDYGASVGVSTNSIVEQVKHVCN